MTEAGAVGPIRIEFGTDHRTLAPGEILTIGRDPAGGLAIDDGRVSRHHLRVAVGPEGWTVEDLNSSNGTFCAGSRVTRLVVSTPTTVMLSLIHI